MTKQELIEKYKAFKEGNKIYIKVPKSSVTSTNTPVYFKVSTSKNTYRSKYTGKVVDIKIIY